MRLRGGSVEHTRFTRCPLALMQPPTSRPLYAPSRGLALPDLSLTLRQDRAGWRVRCGAAARRSSISRALPRRSEVGRGRAAERAARLGRDSLAPARQYPHDSRGTRRPRWQRSFPLSRGVPAWCEFPEIQWVTSTRVPVCPSAIGPGCSGNAAAGPRGTIIRSRIQDQPPAWAFSRWGTMPHDVLCDW